MLQIVLYIILIIASWMQSHMLEVCLLERYLSGLHGVWGEACAFAPVTRVPLGSQAGRPSLLDYAITSLNLVQDCYIDWYGSESDHAVVVYFLKGSQPHTATEAQNTLLPERGNMLVVFLRISLCVAEANF